MQRTDCAVSETSESSLAYRVETDDLHPLYPASRVLNSTCAQFIGHIFASSSVGLSAGKRNVK